MNVLDKIKRSWWVIFSAIIILNGIGFLYIGFKNNNRNWVLEGIIYEIPWVFGIIFADFDSLATVYVAICMILMLVSIVRSVWVAIKLADVYDNEDKYAIQSAQFANSSPNQNNNFPMVIACVSCLILVFLAYALLVLI